MKLNLLRLYTNPLAVSRSFGRRGSKQLQQSKSNRRAIPVPLGVPFLAEGSSVT